jgi:16S rRNA (cytosine1402-N4)-methyltransferase
VFMALRIAVNHELDNLRQFLRRVPEFQRPGGKLAVISFHSLEDGIVKQFLRAAKAEGTFEEITRRPVVASPDERRANPRSRSAKLRVAMRLEQPMQQGGSDGPE